MSTWHVMISTMAIFATALATAQAGPCSPEIDRMQARVDARLAARASAGTTGSESSSALLHRQPTPDSIAKAEEGLRELSAEKVATVQRAMEQARAADRAGDASACAEALAAAQRALD
jgi:hypothetical protein